MTPLARLQAERVGAVSVVRIAGEIDMSNAPDVLAAIESNAGTDVAAVVLALAEVEYLDSAGVRIVFALADRLRATRQVLRLVVPEEAPIRSTLELMGVPRVVPVFPNVDDAVSGLG